MSQINSLIMSELAVKRLNEELNKQSNKLNEESDKEFNVFGSL